MPFHIGTKQHVIGRWIDLIHFLRCPWDKIEILIVAEERVEYETHIAAPVGRALGKGMRRAHAEGRRGVKLPHRSDRLDLKERRHVIAFEAESLRRLDVAEQRYIHGVDLIAGADRP